MNNLNSNHITTLSEIQKMLIEKIRTNFEIIWFDYNPDSLNYRVSLETGTKERKMFFAYGRNINEVVKTLVAKVKGEQQEVTPIPQQLGLVNNLFAIFYIK